MSISVPTSSPSGPGLGRGINLRVICFVAIFAALLGWPLYLYLDATLSKGIKNRGNYFEVDLKAMSDFRFDQNQGTIDGIPKQWRDLNNKSVVLEGEMAPTSFSAAGTGNGFDLVYSVQKCCFSGTPQVQHFVSISLVPNAKVDMGSGGALRVSGTLKVDVKHDETGKIIGVYHVVADGVTPV